jgi:hypothetical protein
MFICLLSFIHSFIKHIIMLRYPLLLLLAITVSGISPEECMPFGLRLNYGRSVYDRNSQ